LSDPQKQKPATVSRASNVLNLPAQSIALPGSL